VQDQVGKAHLLRRGFVTEPIRRHLLDGSDQVFLLVGKDLLHYARDRIFVLLREANRSRSKEREKGNSAFHGNAPEVRPKDKPAKPNSPLRDRDNKPAFHSVRYLRRYWASLENKSLAELEQVASDLRKRIAGNPDHSTMEKVELEDVEGWIKLRRREAKPGPRSDDDITL
jgi:hypothetical protein